MSSRDKYNDSSIDDILSEIGNGGDNTKPAVYSDDALDAILNELGYDASPANKKHSVPKKPKKEVAGSAKKAPEKSLQVEHPRQNAEQNLEKAQDQRREKAQTPREGAPGRMVPKNQVSAPKKKGQNPADVNIMDIEVNHSTAPQHRMGKAAAMEKVQPDKYVNDPNLASWFGSNNEENVEADKPKRQLRKRRVRRRVEPAESAQLEKDDLAEEKRRRLREELEFNEAVAPVLMADTQEIVLSPKGAKEKSKKDNKPPKLPLPPQDVKAEAVRDVQSYIVATGKGQPEEAEANEGKFDTWQGPALSGVKGRGEEAWTKEIEKEERLPQGEDNTRVYQSEHGSGAGRVPKASMTQRINPDVDGMPTPLSREELEARYVDVMVDDKFRDFFKESVAMTDPAGDVPPPPIKRRRKKRSSTGEFAILENKVRKIEDSSSTGNEDDDDYNHLKDAERIQSEIKNLKTSLLRRSSVSAILAVVLFFMSLGYGDVIALPKFFQPLETNPLFAGIYLTLLFAGVAINYKTLLSGLWGLVGKATFETPPALAMVAALVQGVMLFVYTITGKATSGTLFGSIVMALLAVHSIGKVLQTKAILKNFVFASSGKNYSAAYVLNNSVDLAYEIADGLEEPNPALLISRSTTLMKGFMRQSFSQRMSDRTNKVLGWVLLLISALIGGITWFNGGNVYTIVCAMVATFALGAPISSSLAAGFPSLLLQKNAARAGAVIPGWSAMDELGSVNVVMAESGDLFPPESVQVQKVTVFERDCLDSAILYAASVLVAGCDTLREAFLEMIDQKPEILHKVESLKCETGRGFIGWIEDKRVVIGSREMLQRNGVTPPNVKEEMEYLPPNCRPLYLVVSGRLMAMFAVEYRPDIDVDDVLAGLAKNGVSLMVNSYDVNVNIETIEKAYGLPQGMVKMLSAKELNKLRPLTRYLPESEGVMAHLGGFSSLIAGMRAASAASMAEKMSGILQIASVLLAGVLCVLLAFSGSLQTLSLLPVLLYQLAWTLIVSGVPFTRNY